MTMSSTCNSRSAAIWRASSVSPPTSKRHLGFTSIPLRRVPLPAASMIAFILDVGVLLVVLKSDQTPARDWLPPVLPPFFHNTRKEPETELVFKRRHLIAAHRRRDHLQKRLDIRAKHVTRNAGDMRHRGEINIGALGRFHVEPFGLVKERATDAVPVKPAAE